MSKKTKKSINTAETETKKNKKAETEIQKDQAIPDKDNSEEVNEDSKRAKHKKLRLIFAIAYGLLFIVGAYALLSVFVFSEKEEAVGTEIEKEETAEAELIEVNDDTESVIPISKEELQAMREADKEEEEPAEEVVEETEIEKKAGQLLSQMNLNEKIYQMIILTPEQLTETEDVSAAGARTKDSLEKYPVGGIIYSAGNLKDPSQTKTMISNTIEIGQKTVGVPLFLCVSEEGGKAVSIGSNSAFKTKSVPAMGSVKSADDAYNAGHTIGEYLWELGFNVDFAPDCNVITDQGSIVGDRSFGSDPNIVRDYSASYLGGLHDSRILSAFKCFPGYGATADDFTAGPSSTGRSLDELKEAELIPFMYASSAGADFVMVGHMAVPSITGDDTPASLSYQMVTELLEDELSYNGIIITDALNSEAITGRYEPAQAAVMAIKAGNDMLLMPADHASIPDKIKEAIDAGEISEEQINASVKKILVKKLVMTEEKEKRIKEEKEAKEKAEKEKKEKKNKSKKKK